MKIFRVLVWAVVALAGDRHIARVGASLLTAVGHPEWIDFPREGNNWSMHYSRRQWSISTNPGCHRSNWRRRGRCPQ